MHQAPTAGVPPPNSAGPNPSSAFEIDLPPELLNQGWRKFWYPLNCLFVEMKLLIFK